jgi:hypothetical protein
MIYVMAEKSYWKFIEEGVTHDELIEYINRTFGLRGKIETLHIVKI